MSPKRMFIDCEFGQMHVRMSEKSPNQDRHSLYCIHQSPSSSVVYNPIIMKLGNSRFVAAGDTPGFGESDEPNFLPEITLCKILAYAKESVFFASLYFT